jgi:hypothetical protein
MEIFSGFAYYLLKRFVSMIDLKQYLNESLLDDFDTIAKNQDDGIMIDQWISTCEFEGLRGKSSRSELNLKHSYSDGVLHIGVDTGDWFTLYINKPIPSIIKKIVLTSRIDIGFRYKVKDPEIFTMFEAQDDTVTFGAIFNYALDGIREVRNTTFNAVTFWGASVKFKNCKLIERGTRLGFIRLKPKCRQTLEDLVALEYIQQDGGHEIYINAIGSSIGKRILRATKIKDESKRHDLHDIQKTIEKWLPDGYYTWYSILFHEEDREQYLIHELIYLCDTKEWRIRVK